MKHGKIFVMCPRNNTQQRGSLPTLVCRERFAVCYTRQSLCRVFFGLCRVLLAHGKLDDSRSVQCSGELVVNYLSPIPICFLASLFASLYLLVYPYMYTPPGVYSLQVATIVSDAGDEILDIYLHYSLARNRQHQESGTSISFMLCCSDLKRHVHSGNLFVQQCRGRRLSLQLFMRCYCAAPPNTLRLPILQLIFSGSSAALLVLLVLFRRTDPMAGKG